MALGSAALFLPIFNIVAFEQMLYFAGEEGERERGGGGGRGRRERGGRIEG